MCQEASVPALMAMTEAVVENKLLVAQCTTGYHRDETSSAVVANVVSHHSKQHDILHLSMARCYQQDIQHDINVALKFLEQGWEKNTRAPKEPFASQVFRLRAACWTRPEAWANFALFEESRSQLANCLHMLGSFFSSNCKSRSLLASSRTVSQYKSI